MSVSGQRRRGRALDRGREARRAEHLRVLTQPQHEAADPVLIRRAQRDPQAAVRQLLAGYAKPTMGSWRCPDLKLGHH